MNLVSMPYVGGYEYNLIESNKVKTKFAKDEKDSCYQILFLWIVKKSCHIQYKIIIGQEVYIWIILKDPYIPPLREELHVEENTFLEEYVEVRK